MGRGKRRGAGICAGVVAAAASALMLAPAAYATDYPVVNNNDGGVGSFRQALMDANANMGPDTISFSLPLVGGDTITPTSTPLPGIISPVAINGCSGNVNATAPCVGLADGFADLTFATGSGGSAVRGFAFTGTDFAISLDPGVTGLEVQNNYFGLDLAGNDGADNTVAVLLAGSGAQIGGTDGPTGTAPNDRNVFADNTRALEIGQGDNHTIQGNYFGVDEDGSTARANVSNITFEGSGVPPSGDMPTGTVIGGADAGTPGVCDGACNVIANASGTVLTHGHGITLQKANAQSFAVNTTIRGNFIGLNALGLTAANALGGIQVVNAPGTTIGGPSAADRNFISLGAFGIAAFAQGAPDLSVQNNYIGLDPTGTALRSNSGPDAVGAFIRSDPGTDAASFRDNRVALQSLGNSAGLLVMGEDAVISGNTFGIGVGGQQLSGMWDGIQIQGTSGDQARRFAVTGNVIGNTANAGINGFAVVDGVFTGNRIGLDGSGNPHPIAGNGINLISWPGIPTVSPAAPSTGNTIGGDLASEENVISNVTGNAIFIGDDGSDFNTIARNRGSSNGQLFIDLLDYNGGETPGPGTGPTASNESIDAPAISSARQSLVQGSGAETGATIRVFRKQTVGLGEIEAFAGSTTADAGGNWSVIPAPALPAGGFVAATQTDTDGNTSELSNAIAVQADPPTTAKDSTPPSTTITETPKNKIKTKKKRVRVAWEFTSSEPGQGGFQCQIDAEQFVLCTSPFSVRVGPGPHTFRVRAFDAAGNPDSTLEIDTFKVKKAKPKP